MQWGAGPGELVECLGEGDHVQCSLPRTVDKLMRKVVEHHAFLREQGSYSIVKLAAHTVQKYGIEGDLAGSIESGIGLPEAMMVTNQLKAAQAIKLIKRLRNKTIHGVYYQNSMAPGIDYEGFHTWLTDGTVRAETEALIVAAQDGVLFTNRYQAVVVKNGSDPKCRICREGDETICHILTSCEAHLWSLIKERHDQVVYQLVLALARSQGLMVPDSWGWRAQGWVWGCWRMTERSL